MSKAEEIRENLKNQRNEVISEIKKFLINQGAEEVSFKRGLVWQYIDDQFSVNIDVVSQIGIILGDDSVGECEFIPFEDERIEIEHLIMMLDELEQGRFEIDAEFE